MTMHKTGLSLNQYFKISPEVIPLTICGMVMDILNNPMYIPIWRGGSELASMA